MAHKMLVLFVAILSCVCAEEKKFYFIDHEFDKTEFGESLDRASMSFLKEAYESADDKNVVASPLGVFGLLNMYAGGSGPEAQEELTRILGTAAENYTELSNLYGAELSKLAKSDSNFFTFGNKVYLSDQYTLQPDFEAEAAKSQGEVEKINFIDTRTATDTINKWGEEKTRGYIKNAVPEGAITPDTVLTLANVIYLKGHWGIPFKAEETREEPFYLDKDTIVQKPMMRLMQPLFYYEGDDVEAQIIELPYKEKPFRMVVVVPNEVDGLSSVLDKLKTKGLLTYAFKLQPINAEIDLHMPKFNIKSEFDLKELLPKMGIAKIFEERAFGIVKDDGVRVSKAFQKAFVEVNEEGATAGAFTGVVAVPISSISKAPEPIEVKVDRPFLFAILSEDKILFTGTYTH